MSAKKPSPPPQQERSSTVAEDKPLPISSKATEDTKCTSDSVSDSGYQSMSCSTATDISKSTCSFLDSGIIEEEIGEEGDVGAKGDSGREAEAGDHKGSVQTRLLHTAFSLKDIYTQDKEGDTLLHMACMEGWTALVCKFIRQTPHPDLLDLKNEAGQAPLHVAVLCNHLHVVRLLVVAGATIDVRDGQGCTPFHLACRSGSLPLVEEFLTPITQEQVDFLRLKYKVVVQNAKSKTDQLLLQRTYSGDTALHLAVRSGSRDLVERLLMWTPDPNAQERYEGNTALHLACRFQRVDLAELLVKSGRAQINALNYARQTPLRSTWPLYRAQPQSRALFRLVMLLREYGGLPTNDPGSEDEDSYEEGEDEEEEEEEEDNEESENNGFRTITLLVNDTFHNV